MICELYLKHLLKWVLKVIDAFAGYILLFGAIYLCVYLITKTRRHHD